MNLVDGIGTWKRIEVRQDLEPGCPAVFLDRDGVVVEEVGFLKDPDDIRLTRGAAESIAEFNSRAVPVIVVTNQSGIARGLLTWSDFERVQAELEKQLEEQAGARLTAVLACGYHPDGTGAPADRNHFWRKPNPGMLIEAAHDLRLNLTSSTIIGDRERDLSAGRSAGLKRGVLVNTGYGGENEWTAATELQNRTFTVDRANDLRSAVELVTLRDGD